MKDLRSIVLKLVIGCFSLAALLGILALLGAGQFGETEGKILLTTLLVGTQSVGILAYLTVSETRWWPIGAIGAVISAFPFAVGLTVIWSRFLDDNQSLIDITAITTVLAVTIAQASLLLWLQGRSDPGILVWFALLAMAILAAMIIAVILIDGDPGSVFWRLFGIVAILDALGTVTVIALGVFGKEAAPVRHGSGSRELSAAIVSRLVREAERRDVTPDQLLAGLLDDAASSEPLGNDVGDGSAGIGT